MGNKISLGELARMADRNDIVGNKNRKLEGENEIKFFEWMAQKEGYDTLEIKNFYQSGALIEPDKEEVKQKVKLMEEPVVDVKAFQPEKEEVKKQVVSKPKKATANKPQPKQPANKKTGTKQQTTTQKPVAKPATKPTAKPAAKPKQQTVAQKPAAKPATKPTAKPAAKPKQQTAAQKPAINKAETPKQQASAQKPATKPAATSATANKSKKTVAKSEVMKDEPGFFARAWNGLKNFFTKDDEIIVPAEEVEIEDVYELRPHFKQEKIPGIKYVNNVTKKSTQTPNETFLEKAQMVLDSKPILKPLYGGNAFEVKIIQNLNSKENANDNLNKQVFIINVSDNGKICSIEFDGVPDKFDGSDYTIINGKIYERKNGGVNGNILGPVNNQSAYTTLKAKLEKLVKQYKKEHPAKF